MTEPARKGSRIPDTSLMMLSCSSQQMHSIINMHSNISNTSNSDIIGLKDNLSLKSNNSVASDDKEILEPTLDNLRRLELKQQRRDMQSSLVSSSISNIIASIHNKPKSTFMPMHSNSINSNNHQNQ